MTDVQTIPSLFTVSWDRGCRSDGNSGTPIWMEVEGGPLGLCLLLPLCPFWSPSSHRQPAQGSSLPGAVNTGKQTSTWAHTYLRKVTGTLSHKDTFAPLSHQVRGPPGAKTDEVRLQSILGHFTPCLALSHTGAHWIPTW